MKKAAIFLILTFLLSWLPAFLFFGSGVTAYTATWLAVAVYFMFTPSISAIITQKLIYRQNVTRPLGLSLRPNAWFFVALLIPAFMAISAVATSLVFPDVSFTTDPAESSILLFAGQNLAQDQAANVIRSADQYLVHPFFMVLIGGTLAGLTINGLAGLGEELGWRGLLLSTLAPMGFWRSSFAIGGVWGLWHLPFILHGHNYPGYPLAGIFMMILWTLLFSPLIGYVCIRANSVIAAAMMHGALNGTAMAPLLVLKGGNVLQIGVMGIAGIAVLICLNMALLAVGKPDQWLNQWMAQRSDDTAQG